MYCFGIGTIFKHPVIPTLSPYFVCLHLKHRKREPVGVHGTARGFNRKLRQQAAVANNNHLAPKFSSGLVYYTSLIILSKPRPNQPSSSRENAKKTKFSVTALALSR